jgi:hypothetical protein
MRKRGRKKGDRAHKTEVFEHTSGLRLIRSGRSIVMDDSFMSEEARSEWKANLRAYAKDLPRLVKEDATKVKQILGSLPTLPALSVLGYMAYRIDPDNYVEWEREWVSVQVEWPTRVALSLPSPIELDSKRPILEPKGFQELLDTLESLHSRMKDMISTEFVRRGRESPNDYDNLVLRHRQYQLNIRTLAYHHQQRAWLERLFNPLASELEYLLGFNVEDAIRFTVQISEAVGARLAEKIRLGRESMPEVERSAMKQTSSPEEARQFAEWAVSTWASTFMDEVFTVLPTDFDAPDRAAKFLQHFSLGFGQPDPGRPGASADLLLRPIVGVGSGQYLCHIPLLLDAIRANLEDVLKADKDTWQKYEDTRSTALEERTAELLAHAMPAACVDMGLKYRLPDGSEPDLDILCRIDRTLILCECKSGAVQPPHKQGTMLRSLRRLLGRAHEQALRAKQHITDSGGRFVKPSGEVIVIRPDEYDRIVLAVVTLDDIAPFSTNMAYAVGSGVFQADDIPWAVSVTDLEIISDICDLNGLLPHYLTRRSRTAMWDKFTAIEELDWFMHYLKDGLWFADDLDQTSPVNLLSFTQPLDDYYMYTHGPRRKPAPKPGLECSAEFKDLLVKADSRRRAGWMEACLMLLEVSRETQETILQMLRDLRRKTKPAGRVLLVGDFLIALYAEPAKLGMLRPAMMRYAKAHMVKGGVQRAVCIGLDNAYGGSPLIGYIDAAKETMPSLVWADSYLSRFDSRRLAAKTELAQA